LLEKGELEEEFSKNGIPVVFIDISKRNIFLKIYLIYKYLKSQKPAIIQTHLYHGNVFGQIAAMLAGVKFRIATYHNAHVDYNWRSKILMNMGLLCSHKIISVSQAVRRFWKKNTILCDSKVEIVYNAPGFVTVKNTHFSETDITKKQVVSLLCLSNIHPIKGHLHAIKALHTLRQITNRYYLNIYGKDRDGYSKELERMIIDLGLENNVKLKGPTYKPQDTLLEHDILLMPSLSEGFPLVSVEGMSVGIPIIASNIPAHQEIFENGKYGIVIDTKDTTLLCENIVALSTDSEKYHFFSKQGLIRSRIFTVDEMSKNYCSLYQYKSSLPRK
jgi:glycosyltransferase involved in cell wall biosynthesis